MKPGSLSTAVLTAFALCAATPSFAADTTKTGNNVDPSNRATSAQTQAVTLAALADRLARYGDANRDAIAMIAAARMLASVGPENVKHDKQTEGGAKGGPAQAGRARDVSVSGLLARAKEYAGGRPDLLALADEAAKSGVRGASGGPKRALTEVNARTTDVFRITFRGGQPAIIAISGDGDTDLDLTVEDENGNRVCVADGPGDDEVCRWTPRWTGPFRVRVRNLGNVWNRYRLLTN